MQAPYIPDSTLSAGGFHSRASHGTSFKMIPSYKNCSWGKPPLRVQQFAQVGEPAHRNCFTRPHFCAYYGKHFTRPPSLQPRLFLGCNPICLIVKVLASFRFLFIRSSVASDPLIRSRALYNNRKPCYIKIWFQICKAMTDRLLRSFSSAHRLLSQYGCEASHSQAKKMCYCS